MYESGKIREIWRLRPFSIIYIFFLVLDHFLKTIHFLKLLVITCLPTSFTPPPPPTLSSPSFLFGWGLKVLEAIIIHNYQFKKCEMDVEPYFISSYKWIYNFFFLDVRCFSNVSIYMFTDLVLKENLLTENMDAILASLVIDYSPVHYRKMLLS